MGHDDACLFVGSTDYKNSIPLTILTAIKPLLQTVPICTICLWVRVKESLSCDSMACNSYELQFQ